MISCSDEERRGQRGKVNKEEREEVVGGLSREFIKLKGERKERFFFKEREREY